MVLLSLSSFSIRILTYRHWKIMLDFYVKIACFDGYIFLISNKLHLFVLNYFIAIGTYAYALYLINLCENNYYFHKSLLVNFFADKFFDFSTRPHVSLKPFFFLQIPSKQYSCCLWCISNHCKCLIIQFCFIACTHITKLLCQLVLQNLIYYLITCSPYLWSLSSLFTFFILMRL